MNETELKNELIKIFDKYVKILSSYEKTFRNNLANRLKNITSEQLYRLPMEMYEQVSFLKNESTMIYIFEKLSDKYAKDYYQKTVDSFKRSGKLLDSIYQNNGFIYEAMLASTLKNFDSSIEPSSILNKGISALKTVYDFEGIGFEGHHGDIVIKGLEIPVYIDAKYSTDYSQIIETTADKWNNEEDISKQIIREIHRGIGKGISYKPLKKGNELWVTSYIKAEKYKSIKDIDAAKNFYKKGFLEPKILIYIFKDRGLWSSQVIEGLKDRVIDNAINIKRKNGDAFIKGADTKGWLWYGRSKF